MQKFSLFFVLLGLFLYSCLSQQPTNLVNTPTLVTTKTRFPAKLSTDTPTIPTFTPAYTLTLKLTSTSTPTSTLNIPRSVKNKEYWAILSPDRAAFWFMLNPEINEWTWYKAPYMTIEYEWGVEFPISENPYPVYSAEVTLVPSEKGLSPQRGSIDELLRNCDSGLWLMDRGGMLNLNDDNAVDASYFNGGILIELTDPNIISMLFEVRPKTLLFKTNSYFNILPERVIDITVVYQD